MNRNKPWKQLMFLKEVRLTPEDPKNPMVIQYIENNDYDDIFVSDTCLAPRLVSRDRRIQLEANVKVEMQYDYPDDFKKLVVALGDLDLAYGAYKQLQRNILENWADYAEESVW